MDEHHDAQGMAGDKDREMPNHTGWLYSKEGQAMLIEDRPSYEKLWKEGWRDTPAAFGVETHPSVTARPIDAHMGMIGGSPISGLGQEPAHYAALERQVAQLLQSVAEMQAAQEGMQGRLTAVQGAQVPTVAPPPTTSLSRGHEIVLEKEREEEEARVGREAMGREEPPPSAGPQHGETMKPSPQALQGTPPGTTDRGGAGGRRGSH